MQSYVLTHSEFTHRLNLRTISAATLENGAPLFGYESANHSLVEKKSMGATDAALVELTDLQLIDAKAARGMNQ